MEGSSMDSGSGVVRHKMAWLAKVCQEHLNALLGDCAHSKFVAVLLCMVDSD